MKLVVKGRYESEEQLPVADLPPQAVRFVEPETPEELNKQALKFTLPALAFIILICGAAAMLRGRFPFGGGGMWMLLGVALSLLFIVPHELLHGICFPKDAEVQLFYSIKNGMAFVISTEPVSKARFIGLSLCPNLVLGWLPLLLWAALPLGNALSQVVFGCSVTLILMGAGDYLNIYNAMRQMPKGSVQVMSGFHSYWYMPEQKQG